jgi:hypothetical protein
MADQDADTTTAESGPPPKPAQNGPSGIAKLLAGLGQAFQDPNHAALLGFASSLLSASGKHPMVPITMGQALGSAAQGAQQSQAQALQNAQQQQQLRYATGKTNTALGLFKESEQPTPDAQGPASQGAPQATGQGQTLPFDTNSPAARIASARAFTIKLLGGDPMADPLVAQQVEAARNSVTPFNQGANTATTSALDAARGGLPNVRGDVPAGATQDPRTGETSIAPGAALALAQSAYNEAGGGAAGRLAYDQILKLTGYFKRAPGEAGAFHAPAAPPFVPSGGAPAQTPAPTSTPAVAPPGGGPLLLSAPPTGAQQLPPVDQGSGAPPAPGTGAYRSAMSERTLPARLAVAAAAQRAAQQPAATPAAAGPATNQQQGGGGGLVSPGMSVQAYSAAKSVGDQTGHAVESATDANTVARNKIAVYDQMGQALAQMGATGRWRDLSTPLGNLANYFGLTPFNITSAAEFEKYRVQLVGAATKEVSPRASEQELAFLAKQVPNYDLPGNAPRVLLAELKGLEQYKLIHSNALPIYLEQMAPNAKGLARGTSLGFESWFNKNGPSPSAVVLASVVSTLPPTERSTYVKQLKATATGKYMLNQYQRAQTFEQRYPDAFGGL